jgi:CRISPR associated protein Cas2 family
MTFFVISYDLHNARAYEPIHRQLKSWGAVRMLESVWLANLNGNATQVRNILQNLGDSDDSFAVLELKQGSDWATIRAKPGATEWLRANIHP